jgi:hypothetical protein
LFEYIGADFLDSGETSDSGLERNRIPELTGQNLLLTLGHARSYLHDWILKRYVAI